MSLKKMNTDWLKPHRLAINILLWSSAIFMLFPLYWIFTGSLKLQSAAIIVPPEIIPLNPSISNFIELLERAPIGIWFLNSLIITSVGTLGVCLLCSLGGYGLAKKNFYGKNFIFWLIIASMMIPRQLLLIPLFSLLMKFGLINTLAAAILPILGWPFGIFLMKQFTQTLPTEIIDAAKIDGCSEIRLFTHIVFPMIKPGIGALAIFTFSTLWSDYLWQLIVLTRRNNFSLPVGIATLKSEYIAEYGLQMAGAVIAAVPLITIFLIFQRYFIKGITLGGVKG